MKRRTNHILTTHTGSLPRPTDLVEMVLCKEMGRGIRGCWKARHSF